MIMLILNLSKKINKSEEWILSRTGIENRHLVKEGEATSDMGTQIAKRLLEKSGKSPEEIDLILVATSTPDFPVVSTAALIQDKIGAINAWGYDIVAACTGFVYAMETGSKLVESGQYKCVIVIGSDTMSSIIDYTDKNTCVIFGDGGGGVILEPTENEKKILKNFQYKKNIGYLHNDDRLMPVRKNVWSSWNSILDKNDSKKIVSLIG